MDKLTEENFLIYAARHYDNPSCLSTEEFLEDLGRFKYIKRLCNRYKKKDDLRVILILNHIVILYNMFGPDATARMLFLKCEEFMDVLKPFLIYLSIWPEVVKNVGDINILYTSEIPLDSKIVEELRKINK